MKKAKTRSQTIFYTLYNSSTLATCVHMQELQLANRLERPAGGGGACNGGKITLCPKIEGGGGGGGA